MVNLKKHNIPKCLPQFTHINRFADPSRDFIPTAKLLPGEYYVTKHEEALSTVLGSCIACCIYDVEAKVGGMNHFMLPKLNDNGSKPNWDLSHPDAETRFGNYAMEKLINEIMKYGGRRAHLQFKLFGGGNVLGNNSQQVGKRNIEFAEHFIASEGFQIISSDVGSIYPRKIIFHPMSGRVQVKRLATLANHTLTKREDIYEAKAKIEFKRHTQKNNDVELF